MSGARSKEGSPTPRIEGEGVAPSPLQVSLPDEEIRAVWDAQEEFHPDPVKFARAVIERLDAAYWEMRG